MAKVPNVARRRKACMDLTAAKKKEKEEKEERRVKERAAETTRAKVGERERAKGAEEML